MPKTGPLSMLLWVASVKIFCGAYPTLIREVKEECGIDITQQLEVAKASYVSTLVVKGKIEKVKVTLYYDILPTLKCGVSL